MSDNDDIPFVRAFRGLISDHRNGLIDDEAMERAMDTLFQPDMTASLGATRMDSGMLDDAMPGYDMLDIASQTEGARDDADTAA